MSDSPDWSQTNSNGDIVIPYGFSPGFKWKDEIDSHLLELTRDIGCMKFIREDSMSTSTYENGVIFIDGDDYADGKCWSPLGVAPGFRGTSTTTVIEFGAPAGWQVLSLSAGCGGGVRYIVHHEVGHMLGRFHEFRRPDRDIWLNVSPAALTQGAEMYTSWRPHGFPLDISSAMMYGTTLLTHDPAEPDLTAKDGSLVPHLFGFTTMDALTAERHYCGAQAGTYKNKVICPQAAATGLMVPIFTDRLCDNIVDCPGGKDEDGSMETCNHSDSTPRNDCCKVGCHGDFLSKNFGRNSVPIIGRF